jgi:hypothetical protein
MQNFLNKLFKIPSPNKISQQKEFFAHTKIGKINAKIGKR